MTPQEKKNAQIAALAARGIHTFSIPVSPKHQKRNTMKCAIERTAAPGVNTEDPSAEKKLAAIGKILGVDSSDFGALRKAFEALFGPAERLEEEAKRKLSETEIAAARKAGVSLSKYLATRKSIKARSAGSR